MTLRRADRDAQILAMRAKGESLEAIGRRFDLSRERVRQIINELGGPSAAEAIAVRQAAEDEQLAVALARFQDEFAQSTRRLAAAGMTRSDIEDSLRVLCPDLSRTLLRQCLDELDVLFNVSVNETTYSDETIEAAVWHALGAEHDIAADRGQALRFVDPALAVEVRNSLTKLGVGPELIADVVARATLARRAVESGRDLSLSKQRYDRHRSAFLHTAGLETSKGLRPWPPTSQTVMKRFGKGYWATALEELGISPLSGGRERGPVVFAADDYTAAVADYMEFARDGGSNATIEGYKDWADAEDRAGRRRPSVAAVRTRFRNWTTAKRKAREAASLHAIRVTPVDRGAPRLVSKGALLAAEASLASALDLRELPRAEASVAARRFVRAYVEEYEVRRRDWFRAVVRSDEGAFERRWAAPSGLLTNKQRSLAPIPENLDAVLTDRYLDRLLSDGDPNATDGWLRKDLQDELDRLAEVDRRRFTVLRSLRNLFTHHSDEAELRVSTTLGNLAQLEDGFTLRQRPSPVVLADWLLSNNLRRLTVLSGAIPAWWRTAVVVETLAAPDREK